MLYIMMKILKNFPLNSLDFSQANTFHTNIIHTLYTFVFYFPLHVSAIHIGHHHVEYRYRRRSVTEKVFHLKLVC